MTKEAVHRLFHQDVEDIQVLRIVLKRTPHHPIFGILEARYMDGSCVIFSPNTGKGWKSATHDEIRSMRFLSSRQLAKTAQKAEMKKR